MDVIRREQPLVYEIISGKKNGKTDIELGDEGLGFRCTRTHINNYPGCYSICVKAERVMNIKEAKENIDVWEMDSNVEFIGVNFNKSRANYFDPFIKITDFDPFDNEYITLYDFDIINYRYLEESPLLDYKQVIGLLYTPTGFHHKWWTYIDENNILCREIIYENSSTLTQREINERFNLLDNYCHRKINK